MQQFYSDPRRKSDPNALPNCEVFYLEQGDMADPESGEPLEAGFYYWFAFPGCLPNSDAIGPYATEQEAIKAAQDGLSLLHSR